MKKRLKSTPSVAPISGVKRPTMTDVAVAAGVSQSTVSMVLNNMTGARLSDSTRTLVLQTALDLGYRLPRRDSSIQAVLNKEDLVPDLIAYIVDELATSPHPVQSIDGARDAAWENGYMLHVAVTHGNQIQEQAVVSSFRDNPKLLGIVYSTIFTRQVHLSPDLLDYPLVLLNCNNKDFMGASVQPNEVMGGQSATQHLIQKEHQRIAFINGEPWMEAAQDRLKGYRRALSIADIQYDPALVREGDWMASSGYRATLSLMESNPKPTAIFCANDLMAIGAMQALQSLGLRIPQDIALIGYDNQEISQHLKPSLTTIELPNYEMGKVAVESLLETYQQLKKNREGQRKRLHKIECPLVLRESA